MKKPNEKTVYCGPSIPHVAKKFTVYEEVPEALRTLADQCKPVVALLVPLSAFAETKRALKDPTSKEAILYNYIQNYLKEVINNAL